MNEEYTSRDLLLMCRSKYEINKMREHISKQNIKNIMLNNCILTLSADCLRYIEALEKAEINANNIEKVKEKCKN